MARLAPSFVLVTVAACGASSGSPPPSPPAPPDRCVADPALAGARRPKPAESGCLTAEAWDALASACAAQDPDACYRLAVCIQQRDLGAEPAARAASLEDTRTHLRLACDAGIAEACTVRVGFVRLADLPAPADACADLLRGCGLGDADACSACRLDGC